MNQKIQIIFISICLLSMQAQAKDRSNVAKGARIGALSLASAGVLGGAAFGQLIVCGDYEICYQENRGLITGGLIGGLVGTLIGGGLGALIGGFVPEKKVQITPKIYTDKNTTHAGLDVSFHF